MNIKKVLQTGDLLVYRNGKERYYNAVDGGLYKSDDFEALDATTFITEFDDYLVRTRVYNGSVNHGFDVVNVIRDGQPIWVSPFADEPADDGLADPLHFGDITTARADAVDACFNPVAPVDAPVNPPKDTSFDDLLMDNPDVTLGDIPLSILIDAIKTWLKD